LTEAGADALAYGIAEMEQQLKAMRARDEE